MLPFQSLQHVLYNLQTTWLIKRWNTIQMTYHPPGNYPKENSVCQAAGRIFQRSNFSFQEVIREKHFGSPLAFKGMPTPKHLPNANPKWIGPSWVAVFLGGAHLGSKRHHLYGPPPPRHPSSAACETLPVCAFKKRPKLAVVNGPACITSNLCSQLKLL